MMLRYKIVVMDIGPFNVEMRRRQHIYEWRPQWTENPQTQAGARANEELRKSGGKWDRVPSHLMDQARLAFDRARSAS